MKLSTSLILSLTLISSSVSAAWYNSNTMYVAVIGLVGARLHTKKSLSQDELDTKRSIADEKSPVEICIRLVDETVIGQYEDAKNDRPATGIVGSCHKFVKENILPLTGTLVLMDKTNKKIKGGLKSFGLEWIANLLPGVPTLAPAEPAQLITAATN